MALVWEDGFVGLADSRLEPLSHSDLVPSHVRHFAGGSAFV